MTQKVDLKAIARRMEYVVELGFDTQLEACYVMGISSPAQLRRYLRAQGGPAWEVLGSISFAGISTDWLLSGLGAMCTMTSDGDAMRQRLAVRYVRLKRDMAECPEDLRPFVEQELRQVQTETGRETSAKPSRKKSHEKAEHKK